jgi:hypothetical protein
VQQDPINTAKVVQPDHKRTPLSTASQGWKFPTQLYPPDPPKTNKIEYTATKMPTRETPLLTPHSLQMITVMCSPNHVCLKHGEDVVATGFTGLSVSTGPDESLLLAAPCSNHQRVFEFGALPAAHDTGALEMLYA